MNKLFILIILTILSLSFFPKYSYANENEDLYKKLQFYIELLGKSAACLNKDIKEIDEVVPKKIRLINQWAQDKFKSEKDGPYETLIINGIMYFQMDQLINNNISCENILDKINNTDWPEDIYKNNEVNKDNENNWKYIEDKSKIDNSIKAYFFNISKNTVSNQIGQDETGSLLIRCIDNKTEALFSWPNFLGTQAIPVEVKIDDGKIEKTTWNTATNGKGIFRINPIKWIKTLSGKKSLIVRLIPYQSGPQELEFDITGIDDVIEKISSICKWKK